MDVIRSLKLKLRDGTLVDIDVSRELLESISSENPDAVTDAQIKQHLVESMKRALDAP